MIRLVSIIMSVAFIAAGLFLFGIFEPAQPTYVADQVNQTTYVEYYFEPALVSIQLGEETDTLRIVDGEFRFTLSSLDSNLITQNGISLTSIYDSPNPENDWVRTGDFLYPPQQCTSVYISLEYSDDEQELSDAIKAIGCDNN